MVRHDPVRDAAAPYSRAFLTVYDAWVIRLSNRFAWRCDATVMLDRYDQHVGRHHLEVGPGSGWYLAHTTAPLDRVTLMDLNPSPLSYTARRLRRTGAVVATARGSVLEPVPTDAGSEFDSIGINFVLHCVPGDFAENGVAFRHLAAVLADDGTLFGSTILGRDVPAPTLFGRALSAGYSQVGAFNNADDDRVGLIDALQAAFDDVDLTDVGAVTLFAARSPRRRESGEGVIHPA